MYSKHDDAHQTIGNSGSAPTLCASIVATLTGKHVTPPDLAKLSTRCGCKTYNSGTSYDLFRKTYLHFGFRKFVQSDRWHAITDCLDNRGLVVCHVNAATLNGAMLLDASPGTAYILAWAYDDTDVYWRSSASWTGRGQIDIPVFQRAARMYFCFYPN